MGHIPSPWIKYLPPTSVNSQSPSPPAPAPADPDTPLNLSKPKSEPLSSHSTNAVARWNENFSNNVEAGSKILTQSLMMQRSFLPYPNLPPPHVSGTLH